MAESEASKYWQFIDALNEGAIISLSLDEDGLVEEFGGSKDLLLLLLSMIIQKLSDEIDEELIKSAVNLGLSNVDLWRDFEVASEGDA